MEPFLTLRCRSRILTAFSLLGHCGCDLDKKRESYSRWFTREWIRSSFVEDFIILVAPEILTVIASDSAFKRNVWRYLAQEHLAAMKSLEPHKQPAKQKKWNIRRISWHAAGTMNAAHDTSSGWVEEEETRIHQQLSTHQQLWIGRQEAIIVELSTASGLLTVPSWVFLRYRNSSSLSYANDCDRQDETNLNR